MVAVSRSPSLHRFTIYYSEGPILRRILTAARHARAEPVWHFVRFGGHGGFKVEVVVGGMSRNYAESFAAQVRRLPAVTKVMWAKDASNQAQMEALIAPGREVSSRL
ncbi:MAG: hypothetical protein AB7E79_07800 [Rhodospirillaceae bacterium]